MAASGETTGADASNSGRCGICGRPLLVGFDPLSLDCGGDCWGCIGQIEAEMGGSPEENISVGFVAKEIQWGWRREDGSGKRPEEFLLPSYLRVRWLHASPDDPVELWSELDKDRQEIRKLELWKDGRVGYASEIVEAGGTWLAERPVPMLDEIAADPQFEPEAISRAEFEKAWEANVR